MAILDDLFAAGAPAPTLGGDSFERDQWMRLLEQMLATAPPSTPPSTPPNGPATFSVTAPPLYTRPRLPFDVPAPEPDPSGPGRPSLSAPSATADSQTGPRPGLPTVSEMLQAFGPGTGRASVDSATGGSLPPPSLAQPVPDRLPTVADLGSDMPLTQPGGRPSVGPFETTVTPEAAPPLSPPPAPPPNTDAIVRGAEQAAADRRGAEPDRRTSIPGILEAIFAGLAGRDLGAENATVRALTQRGISPGLASVISRNPRLLQPVLASLMGPRNPTIVPDGATVLMPDGRTIQPSGGRKPPSGYEWVDPTDQSKGLRAIPGGPGTHISAESAGRLAAMRASLPALADARRVYERAWGSTELWRQFWANVPGVGDVGALSGDVGRAQRSVRTSIEAALRAMTGAAAPESEVSQYLEMYMPNARDSVESARQKLTNLERFMRDTEAVVTQGRTSTPPGTGGAPGAGVTRRYNPQTGRLE